MELKVKGKFVTTIYIPQKWKIFQIPSCHILEKTNENYDKKNSSQSFFINVTIREYNFAMGSGERVLHKHSCIHHDTCACEKPFPKIVSMVKLDIFSCNQYLLVKSLLFHISLFVPFLVGIEFIKNVKHLMMTNNSW